VDLEAGVVALLPQACTRPHHTGWPRTLELVGARDARGKRAWLPMRHARHLEESADTHHDRIYRCHDKSGKWSPTDRRLGLPWSSALRCTSFLKCCAPQCQTPRDESKANWDYFPIYIGLIAYGHGVCLHSLHTCFLKVPLALSHSSTSLKMHRVLPKQDTSTF
jgi:hypothetical protein